MDELRQKMSRPLPAEIEDLPSPVVDNQNENHIGGVQESELPVAQVPNQIPVDYENQENHQEAAVEDFPVDDYDSIGPEIEMANFRLNNAEKMLMNLVQEVSSLSDLQEPEEISEDFAHFGQKTRGLHPNPTSRF